MNRHQLEKLRCIIKGNDQKYSEQSTDVKLFQLACNHQIPTITI